ncbi:VOC family protein [Fictibacillus iocasae]|uniref:VOC family protein n=1 Tax=Fictibacillus iocasae TaxID=2715437 RepID=A0ABW2NUZ7_9BACL
MAGRLYETHVKVRNLERAKGFYEKLGMTAAHEVKSRGASFFYFGDAKEQMLGVWEVASEHWTSSHFAFRVSLEQLLGAEKWLSERGIKLKEAFGLPPIEPIVHTWMPAAAVYFEDPDGNPLEFIALLDDDGILPPSEGVRYLSEWLANADKG